ncbi:MAG TPA: response regulator transcription factor [Anaerolineae bacterium]|nr:response regulator transcription factor [Anaerolineae bacterium]
MSEGKVLLIDDDPALLQLLGKYLEQVGYGVSTASDGPTGLRILYAEHPDLVVLDVMMPALDGWQVCKRIRELSDVPIIMLTAKGAESDTLRGFSLGVDDYVTKPFSFAELAARISAVLSRAQQAGAGRRAYRTQVDELIVDLETHHVSRAGQVIQLTPTEFRLLQCFVENAGRVLSPTFLLEQVWGAEYTDAIGYIRRYVWYLRQKIEPDPANPTFILTEREFGYRFRKA